MKIEEKVFRYHVEEFNADLSELLIFIDKMRADVINAQATHIDIYAGLEDRDIIIYGTRDMNAIESAECLMTETLRLKEKSLEDLIQNTIDNMAEDQK